MTTDVIKNVKTGNTNTGAAVVYINKLNQYDSVNPDVNRQVNIDGVENSYTNRFVQDSTLNILAKPNQSDNLLEVRDSNGDLTLHIDASGDLFLDDTVWDDMRILPSTFDFPGVTDPAITTWTPGGAGGTTFRIWEFQQTDQGFFTCQLPHTYAEGTDLYPHVHWTPKDRGVAESGKTVDWRLDYSIASINQVFPSSVTVVMKDVCSGVDHKHEIDDSVPNISGSGLRVSAMLVGRFYRGTDDDWVGTSAGQLPCLLELDIHYQINSLGSREERTK